MVDFFAELGTSADVREGAYYADAKSRLLLAEGKPADALDAAEAALEGRDALGITHHAVKESFVAAVEASLQLGDVAKARALLAIVDAPQRARSRSSSGLSHRGSALSSRRGKESEPRLSASSKARLGSSARWCFRSTWP